MNTENNHEEFNRFEMGIDILSRLKAELGQDKQDPSGRGRSNQEHYAIPGFQLKAPSLDALLEEFSPLPEYSVLIGSGEDGLPILLDLVNPEAGSILIAGDPQSGKRRLLTSILRSGIAINSPRNFRFIWISPSLHNLESILGMPHCYRYSSTYEDYAPEMITELVELAEQRSYGRQPGAAVILAIDDLSELVGRLDQDTLSLLLWLVRNGAHSQVWTFATLDARHPLYLGSSILDSFKTPVIGSMEAASAGPNIASHIAQAGSGLVQGMQFCAWFDREWAPFLIPGSE